MLKVAMASSLMLAAMATMSGKALGNNVSTGTKPIYENRVTAPYSPALNVHESESPTQWTKWVTSPALSVTALATVKSARLDLSTTPAAT